VADRDALVTQAETEGFKTHIPTEPITRIYTTKIDKSNRLYVSTLQTLSNCFDQFSPAFFGLIIFDEVHRSIFNKWNEVLQYFDGRIREFKQVEKNRKVTLLEMLSTTILAWV